MTRLRRYHYDQADFEAVFARICRRVGTGDSDNDVDRQARHIVDDVRVRGDEAVREMTEKFDQRSPGPDGSYEVSAERWAEEAGKVAPEVAHALELAADRIATFHREQVPRSYTTESGSLGLRAVPLAKVGLYAPGGTARYPSSVLMTAVPARIAGVDQVVLVTPGASPETLLAARLAGVHRVFEIGGAQAIAALAYGTRSVPAVDKIVGPGNQWVAAAKRLVYGQVDIDSVAGPSEVLIVADDSADPRLVAGDLLAQAEHDVEARPVAMVTTEAIADAIDRELSAQLPTLSRRDIAGRSIESHGVCVVVDSVDRAMQLAEQYAPEHLELAVRNAAKLAQTVRRAGAVFVGEHSPEAAGDYLAGPNHVLPTAGCARYASPLGVYDYIKFVSIIQWSREQLAAVRESITALARVEGLDAHARSVELRFEPGSGDDDG